MALQGGGGTARVLQPWEYAQNQLQAQNTTPLQSSNKAGKVLQPAYNGGVFAPQSSPAPAPAYDPEAAARAAEAARVARAQASEQAYWQDRIDSLNRLLGDTNTQKDQGLKAIGTSYTNEQARANEDQSRALAQYGTQRLDTQTDKISATGRVDTQARTALESLMRILGAGGAGVSSAARELAPYAVSRQAGQQRAGVNDVFGRNLRDIATAETGTKSDFERLLQDLLAQRESKEQDFLRSLYGEQAQINQQLSDAAVAREQAGGKDYLDARAARAPYQQAYNSRLDAINKLFNEYKSPTYTVKPVNPVIPNLAQYTVDPTALRVQAQNPGVDQSVLPYLPFAQRRRENTII